MGPPSFVAASKGFMVVSWYVMFSSHAFDYEISWEREGEAGGRGEGRGVE